MNKVFLLLTLLLSGNLKTSAQSWQWAVTGQGSDFDQVKVGGVVVDGDGNTYATGYFYDVLTVDTFHLTSHGFRDIFWAKFDKYGQVVWAKSTGGKGDDDAGGITVDDKGNLYVFLSFSDTISSDGFQVADTGFWNDLLLAKYDSNGNLLTYKAWGTPYAEIAGSMVMDADDELYIAGTFAGYNGTNPPPSGSRTLTFDSNHQLHSTSNYGSDIFIAKLDTSLSIIWTKNTVGGSSFVDLSINKDKNLIVSGSGCSYTMKFDTITISSLPVLILEFFVAKYDSSGNAVWARMATTDLLGTYGISCATGKDGSVYCTGTYDTPNNISSVSRIKFGNTTLTGDYAFLVKYDANGNLQWAKNLGQTARDGAYDIAVDSMDNLYVTGTFNYTGIFGNDTFYTAGHDDIFVNKYDSNGNHIWTVTAGGVTNDGAYAIALDKDNDIHIGGYISSDPAYFGSYEVSSAGAWDMCVAKLHQYPTGVPELSSFKNTVHIYPNPNMGSFLLDYGDKQYEKLSITDISGREVYHKHISGSTKQQINLNLSDGVYLIRLTGKGNSAVQKLIVQH